MRKIFIFKIFIFSPKKSLTNFGVTSSRLTCNIISFSLTRIRVRSASSSDDNLNNLYYLTAKNKILHTDDINEVNHYDVIRCHPFDSIH
jgi:hypothetical protein